VKARAGWDWRRIADNPQDPAVLDYRDGVLRRTWQDITTDSRIELVTVWAREADVLDLGSSSFPEVPGHIGGESLTDALRRVARSYTSADIQANPEAEKPSLWIDLDGDVDAALDGLGGRTFDVVVAGELIEHLGCPIRLFEIAHAALRSGGALIITTPNPYAPHRVYAGQCHRSWESVDHVTYAFPSGLAELADRTGLVMEAWTTVTWTRPRERVMVALGGRWRYRDEFPWSYVPLTRLLPLLPRWRSSPVGETLVCRFRRT
jgi:SAM-dependent methyltransferase